MCESQRSLHAREQGRVNQCSGYQSCDLAVNWLSFSERTETHCPAKQKEIAPWTCSSLHNSALWTGLNPQNKPKLIFFLPVFNFESIRTHKVVQPNWKCCVQNVSIVCLISKRVGYHYCNKASRKRTNACAWSRSSSDCNSNIKKKLMQQILQMYLFWGLKEKHTPLTSSFFKYKCDKAIGIMSFTHANLLKSKCLKEICTVGTEVASVLNQCVILCHLYELFDTTTLLSLQGARAALPPLPSVGSHARPPRPPSPLRWGQSLRCQPAGDGPPGGGGEERLRPHGQRQHTHLVHW